MFLPMLAVFRSIVSACEWNEDRIHSSSLSIGPHIIGAQIKMEFIEQEKIKNASIRNICRLSRN